MNESNRIMLTPVPSTLQIVELLLANVAILRVGQRCVAVALGARLSQHVSPHRRLIDKALLPSKKGLQITVRDGSIKRNF